MCFSVGAMDDVLDRVCPLHSGGDHHRPNLGLVSYTHSYACLHTVEKKCSTSGEKSLADINNTKFIDTLSLSISCKVDVYVD